MTSVGLTDPAQPDTTYSYMETSDAPVQWLFGGPVGNPPAKGVPVDPKRAINFARTLNTFPGPTVDALMQQCFGGGFAPNFQTSIKNYTFTAATNWNEIAWNTYIAADGSAGTLNNYTNSWLASFPRTNESLMQHAQDATAGAAAVVGPPAYPAVPQDPFYPPKGYRVTKTKFEDPIFTSPDAAPGGSNNTRDLYATPGAANVYALLIAPNTRGNSSRFLTNLDRLYQALTNTLKVPTNQICVLYGNYAVGTMTPGGTPINGAANVANITAASAGTALFGNIPKIGATPAQTAPPAPTFAGKSDLFMYSTGHGNSISAAGVGKATKEVNPGFRTSQIGTGSLSIALNTMPANDFRDADGSDVNDGLMDLQITSSASDLSGLPMTLDPGTPESTPLGTLNFEPTPDTDLSPVLGTSGVYYYDLPVDLNQLNSVLDSGLTPNLEIDGISDSDILGYGDYLASAVTFDDFGDKWTDLVVPEPATLSLLTIGSLALLNRRPPRARRSISLHPSSRMMS